MTRTFPCSADHNGPIPPAALTELIDGASAGINFSSAQLYGIEIVLKRPSSAGKR